LPTTTIALAVSLSVVPWFSCVVVDVATSRLYVNVEGAMACAFESSERLPNRDRDAVLASGFGIEWTNEKGGAPLRVIPTDNNHRQSSASLGSPASLQMSDTTRDEVPSPLGLPYGLPLAVVGESTTRRRLCSMAWTVNWGSCSGHSNGVDLSPYVSIEQDDKRQVGELVAREGWQQAFSDLGLDTGYLRASARRSVPSPGIVDGKNEGASSEMLTRPYCDWLIFSLIRPAWSAFFGQ
jgi:hypothetical protein